MSGQAILATGPFTVTLKNNTTGLTSARVSLTVSAGASTNSNPHGEFHEAEVEHLHQPLLGHDIAGLQIAMDNVGNVRLGQRIGDLYRVLQYFTEAQAIARDQLLSVLPAMNSIEMKYTPSVFIDIVNRDGVGMIQHWNGEIGRC